MSTFFNTCLSPEAEQFEFHSYFPLYRPLNEDYWPESEDEYEEGEEGEEGEKGEEEGEGPPVPEPTEFEKKFAEQSGGNPTLDIENSVLFVQKSGWAPTKEEVREFEQKHPDGVTADELREWMNQTKHTEDTTTYLTELFKKFDPNNTGKIEQNQFRHLLRELGGENALTDDEIHELLKRSGKKSLDEVDYNDFADRLLRRDE